MKRRLEHVFGRQRWLGVLIGVVVILIAGATVFGPTASDDPVTPHTMAPNTKPTCERSLQALLDAAPRGSTVEVPGGCVYRETVTVDKPVTLTGGPGAEIRGSEVWTGWTRRDSHWWQWDGPHWVKGKLPDLRIHGKCEEGTSRCRWPEQVFFDGKPLIQVASNPEPGQFAVDEERNVLLADDPTGHTVEVSVRPHWIVGASDNVTVEGFVMKHGGNKPQGNAALTNGGHSNWTIRNNTLSDAHGAVVSLTGGTGLRLVGNEVFRGGQLGVHGGGGAELMVRDNEIHHNNTENFRTGWEAGGMKTAAVRGLMAEGNSVYDNDGPGLWCDVDCRNVTYANNRIHHNKKMGINVEKSSDTEIYGNTIWENGWGRSEWGWGAGIVSSSSKDVEIHHNTLAWNADGISVISQDRDGTIYDDVTGVRVHNNTLIQNARGLEANEFSLAWLDDKRSGHTIAAPGANNRGSDNEYWYGLPELASSGARYAWDQTRSPSLATFNATPGEENGRYMTDQKKESVISSAHLPSSPEPRG